MKISMLSAALLFSNTLFTSATTYSCKVTSTYQTDEDPNHPLVPAASDNKWALSRVMTSYNVAHRASNDDFTMESSDYAANSWTLSRFGEDNGDEAVDQGPTEEAKEEEVGGSFRGLRRQLQKLAGLAGIRFLHNLRGFTNISCRFCLDWDDDDSMGRVAVGIVEDQLSSTATHSAWEAAWCEELQQSGRPALALATMCKIELYNCKLTSANTLDGGEGEEEEETMGHEVEVAKSVGEGTKDIVGEAKKEIAAQNVESH